MEQGCSVAPLLIFPPSHNLVDYFFFCLLLYSRKRTFCTREISISTRNGARVVPSAGSHCHTCGLRGGFVLLEGAATAVTPSNCEPPCIQIMCWKEEGKADCAWISASFQNATLNLLFHVGEQCMDYRPFQRVTACTRNGLRMQVAQQEKEANSFLFLSGMAEAAYFWEL